MKIKIITKLLIKFILNLYYIRNIIVIMEDKKNIFRIDIYNIPDKFDSISTPTNKYSTLKCTDENKQQSKPLINILVRYKLELFKNKITEDKHKFKNNIQDIKNSIYDVFQLGKTFLFI